MQERRSPAIDAELEGGVELPGDTPLHAHGGYLWVSRWDVWPVTERGLDDGELFAIGDSVYEVVGYQHARRSYYTRRMSLSESDLRRLTDGN